MQKIRQGKFDRLLPPVLDMPLTAKKFQAILNPFSPQFAGLQPVPSQHPQPSDWGSHCCCQDGHVILHHHGARPQTQCCIPLLRPSSSGPPLRCCSDGKGSLTELVCTHLSSHLYSLMYMYGPKTNVPRVWPVCTILGGCRACIWGLIWAEPCGLVPTKPASQAWTSVRLEQYRKARHGSRIGGWCPNDPNRMSIYTQNTNLISMQYMYYHYPCIIVYAIHRAQLSVIVSCYGAFAEYYMQFIFSARRPDCSGQIKYALC